MTKEEFNKKLKIAKLSKKELSAILETSHQSINNWGSNDREIPYWVSSWLDNYIKAKTLDTVVEAVKPYVKETM